MRKYMIGFVCGAFFASAATIYAADAIKATLFPVNYEFNGETKALEEGYATLNYNNRAYVPVRFMAESMDSVVIYDDQSKTIKVDERFALRSLSTPVKAGHLEVRSAESGGSYVSASLYAGQAYWDALHESKLGVERGSAVELTATLAFYNDEGKSMDKLPIRIEATAEGDKLLAVEATSEINLAGYAYAALESVGPEPINAFLPPNLSVQDDTGMLAIGINEMVEDGAFTRIVFDYAVLKEDVLSMEAELAFFDDNGRELGKTFILLGDSGAERNEFGLMPDNVYTMEAAVKGRVAGADSYTVRVISHNGQR